MVGSSTCCDVCGGLIKGGPVHVVFVGVEPVYLCESDFMLGTEAAKALSLAEIVTLCKSRANPAFGGSAAGALEKALARRGKA